MKIQALATIVCLVAPAAASAQAGRPSALRPGAVGPQTKTAMAYEQFLLGHRLEQREDTEGAAAAYKRALDLDPLAADIAGQLAGLFLRENRIEEAQATAEQALKVVPANAEANRVLGMIYAARVENNSVAVAPRGDPNLKQAVDYLERAVAQAPGEPESNTVARVTLAQLYLGASNYEKAIPLLTDLVDHLPGWTDGPLMLTQAYVGAGRIIEGIAWLEMAAPEDPRLLPALADFYERQGRWSDAVGAYTRALDVAPDPQLQARYAAALLSAGGRANLQIAQGVLKPLTAGRSPDPRTLYLLSQVDLRLGDSAAAEADARRLIAEQDGHGPWGFYALAEAFEQRRDYQAVVDALLPALETFRGQNGDRAGLELLLPHVGFAYQELGDYNEAVATFEEAHRLAPQDASVASYLIGARLGAKKFAEAEALATEAHAAHPGDLRIARLLAQALRQGGKADQGIAVLEDALKTHSEQPAAYIALAQIYTESERAAQAVRVLQDAQAKFPADASVAFELGITFDKQKRFAESEAAFRQVLSRDPENAPALNYLGYLLADRGERLDESVALLQKALTIEPDNGSYLDSLGWAYYKSAHLDLAESNLKRAAEQLRNNSVIQDHYGDVLFKLGRYEDAVGAWSRALAGDSDTIDRAEIDKKIRSAKQKIKK